MQLIQHQVAPLVEMSGQLSIDMNKDCMVVAEYGKNMDARLTELERESC